MEKKGEIIPQVVDVVKGDRKGTEKIITWPENCLECGRPGCKEGDREQLQLQLQ
ncbi:MAG: hypothetical protein U0792_11980 [Gemmataceae bacterium]